MNNKLYKKRNEVLTEADVERLNKEYQACSTCREEKPQIEFYPVNEDDRSGKRCNECIICTDIRIKQREEYGAKLKVKYVGLPVRQARKHEAYIELLLKADSQDMFRLNTFREICSDCNIAKFWINFYPKDWEFVSRERIEHCIECIDLRSSKKKETVED